MHADGRAAMAPAADRNADGKARRMACGLLDVDAHDGKFARQTARTDVDFVESLLNHALKFCCAGIGIVRSHRPHQRTLGERRGDFDGTGNADAHEKRRAGINAALADRVENELHDRFVAFNRHEHLGSARNEQPPPAM